MRVVAFRLMMEIILFIKVCHQPDGSSFTSVSTYLQKNIPGCPTSKPWDVLRELSMWGPAHPSSNREAVLPQGWMGIIPLLLLSVGLHHSEVSLLHLKRDQLLSTQWLLFREHVWHFRVTVFIPTLHPWSTQFLISFGKKMYDWQWPMTYVAWRVKTKIEWGRTPYMQPFTWKGIFHSGKISTVL